jgi:hypothetical protein
MTTTQTTQTTTTFVYLVEGEPYIGDIGDYAKAIEHAHYSGLAVDNTVWTFDADGQPVATRAKFHTSDYNKDDYAYRTIELEFACNDPEEATVRIDGRA